MNLVVYANRAPSKAGEEMKASKGSVSYSRSKSVGGATQPTPVTTSTLDTGPSSELVSSVPITSSGEPKVLYSLPIPSIKAGETLRATGNFELTGSHSYAISASARLLLGSSPTDTNGTLVTPRANTTITPQMSRLTMPIDGVYRATSEPGTQYLKLIVKAPAFEAKEGDTLGVASNSGRLAVTRYTPTAGPTSLPTHELGSCASTSEQITTIAVDSNWHSVLACDMGEISTEDLLELSSQLEVGNTNGTNVRLDSRVLAAATPTAAEGGTRISEDTWDTLTSSNRFARVIQSNEYSTNSSSNHYVNLLVRAVPTGGGSFTPLTVEAGSATLNVLRFKPNAGNPAEVMRPGIFERNNWDDVIDKSTVPFAAEGKSPVVVTSAPIDGLRKGDIIRAHGALTADLNGGEAAPVETELIMADSETATTGEAIARRSGDTIPTAQQIHTITKDGTFVAPKASFWNRKYVNLVVYANRKATKEGEALKVTQASVSYSRTQPRIPFSADFEDGSLDQFFRYGEKTTSVTSNQAREGTKSMQTDVDSSSWCKECDLGQDPTESIRRAMIGPADSYTSGGFAGEDRWYGWSVYFPDTFKVPHVEDSYFDGKIDEVRIYKETLSESQIKSDRDEKYGSNPTPVAYYSFNKGSGSVAEDSAGGDNNGTIEGADWTGSGKYGSGLDFNGVKDRVRIPDANELDLTKNFTLEAWVNPDTIRWWNPVISKTEVIEDHAKNNSGYLMNAGMHYFPGSGVFNSGAKAEGFNESKLPEKTWSHLAATSDGSKLRIYVNGELKQTVSAIEAAPTSTDLTIGSNGFSGAVEGTWNVFTQWHHGDDGLDCPTSLPPPIGFNARYFKAGVHFNPNEPGKTATPVSGEYLEVDFNGGELKEDESGICDIRVNPTDEYVLTPLNRGQWYDFVMHTHWTPEKGGPGNSVTSLWMNGKQVLGNETTPVSMPSLFWHGKPEIHNTEIGWSAGLYRGPSAEDPTTRLFIDAVRTGESYAQVAPEAHAPRVDAESYSATLKGAGLKTFTSSKGSTECTETALSGQASAATSQLSLSAEYSGCTATASKFFSTVTMNSCHYNLGVKNAGPPYAGTWGVACEKTGDAIEYKAFVKSGGALLCNAKIVPQPGLEGLALSNTGEGTKRSLRLSGEIKGVKYEYAGGSSCATPEVRTDGVIKGETTLAASNAKAEQIGAYLTGYEVP